MRNSSFELLNLVDSLSEKGDSVAASKYWLQIDPYYLLWFNITPQSIDTFSHFKITRNAKRVMKQKYTAVYKSVKSPSFIAFKKMYEDDKISRSVLNGNADSATYLKQIKKVQVSDLPHFEYLRAYVAKNGWPTISNGSLYAQLLLRHDPDYWHSYLPALRAGVLKGDADYTVYNNILTKLSATAYLELLAQHKNKAEFDVSNILHLQMPSQMNDIMNVVSEHLPIQSMIIVYKAANKKKYNAILQGNDVFQFLSAKLFARVEEYKAKQTGVPEGIQWNIEYEKNESAKDSLILYLLY